VPVATEQRPGPSASKQGKDDRPFWRKPWQLGSIVVIAIALPALAWLSQSGSDEVRTTAPSTTVKPGTPTTLNAGGDQQGTAASNGASSTTVAGPPDTGPAPTIPATITVEGNENVRDGSVVTFHVAAKPGSQMFGFEARLCRAGVTYVDDADVLPTHGGNCLGHQLSAGSDQLIAVRGAPPYESADGSFRVGVGTDTYPTDDGQQATITCGPGNPCVLVLKVQYPNGYGFQAVPLTYA
jgi:hypothetical protein